MGGPLLSEEASATPGKFGLSGVVEQGARTRVPQEPWEALPSPPVWAVPPNEGNEVTWDGR
jgi:hypothetical protein